MHKKRKKLLSVTAVTLTAALGAGIWFGSRGSGEPVNVYPFQYIGMTEFWGDMQESYGPVTTDKIQTEFLSDTQTVTEVKVKDGDTVKKGDVLFTFDTTLDSLSLERKKLDVEKIKVQIKAAEERLQETREMVPYVPPEPTAPEEEDLGEELKDPFVISEKIGKDKKEYDGKSKETAVICWLKDGASITDDILEKLLQTVTKYQKETPQKPNPEEEKTESSASDEPEETNQLDSMDAAGQDLEIPKITIYPFFNGKKLEENEIEEKQILIDGQKVPGYIVPDVWKYWDANKKEKTCWLVSAKRKSDGALLNDLVISGFPREDEAEQQQWLALWEKGIEVQCTRDVTFEGSIVVNNQLVSFDTKEPLKLEINQQAVLIVTSRIKDLQKETEVKYSIAPENGIFKTTQEGTKFFLMGRPEEPTDSSEKYTVTATYSFEDNEGGSWDVQEDFVFEVDVLPEPQAKIKEFYVVFKTTAKNLLKGSRIIWQGAKVTAYENGTFDMQLYNPVGFEDHTIEPEPEIEIDLPEINPDEMYTAEQILDMQKQCYAIIKEQNEKLKMAEAEYSVMERELGDGNVYAEIDGKVVSLLTEDEAKEQRQPLMKVSGGGGFYIEGSVSELEREKLKVGQEVTVNDWQSGGTYTGEVISIGDFPSDDDNWNGMGNPTASYYPFKAFVGEEADLQAGSYVSMSYSTASAEQGIYLEKAFVRTEKGKSCIYVRGADGKLEKRDVKVGKVLWGSYYEILSELSEEDYLAFPYGKNVKPGAPTVESDLSALYSY